MRGTENAGHVYGIDTLVACYIGPVQTGALTCSHPTCKIHTSIRKLVCNTLLKGTIPSQAAIMLGDHMRAIASDSEPTLSFASDYADLTSTLRPVIANRKRTC